MEYHVTSCVRRLINKFIEHTHRKPECLIIHPKIARILQEELGVEVEGEISSVYGIEIRQDTWIGTCCIYIK